MNTLVRLSVLAAALSVASVTAPAQFKETGKAPFSPAVARQKIRTLLENADAGNRDQTVSTISEWLVWYRDVLDEELIARWKGDSRGNLRLVMAPLADARVAREVVEFSWRADRATAFTLADASVLGDLMARYPESAKPFLDDLLPPAASAPAELSLSEPEAETVCRILLDMPEIGTWKKSALQILPRYRATTDRLLKQDLDGPDQEKKYRALRWRVELNLDPPSPSTQKFKTRTDTPVVARQSASDGFSQRPHIVGRQAEEAAPPTGYIGPMSGTWESTGGPIPENGEYVFRNVPPAHLMLDYDTKHWEARLAPGEGQTQVLVLKNKGKGPQKRCVVHWTVIP